MASLLSILRNNPHIIFTESKKLYYGQFVVKLIFHNGVDIYSVTRNVINCEDSWQHPRITIPIVQFNEPVRIRREGDWFSLFLTSVASADRAIAHINRYVKSIHPENSIEQHLRAVEFPLSTEREQQLNSDKIFRRKGFKFKYRVAVTDGLMKRHQPAVKEFLKAVDEDSSNFQFNNGMLYRLDNYSYLYNNFYYCNDLGHITWLRLLDPDFIKKIQEVVTEP